MLDIQCFQTTGRIGRIRYIGQYFLWTSIAQWGLYIAKKFPTGSYPFAMSCIIAIIGLINFFSATARRCHDINKSGWYSLMMVIPIVNFIISMKLFISAGNMSENDYGPPPLAGAKYDTIISVFITIFQIVTTIFIKKPEIFYFMFKHNY